MNENFDKLSIRATDYLTAVDVGNERFLYDAAKTVKGMVCVGCPKRKGTSGLDSVKFVKNIRQLDSSVFDKLITTYSEALNLKSIVRVVDHMGLALINKIPIEKLEIFTKLLEKKAGIVEVWPIYSRNSNFCDILFKVRKY